MDALTVSIHMAFLRANSISIREQERQESISWLAFFMVIFVNTLSHTYTWCVEPFLDVIVSAEDATLGASVCEYMSVKALKVMHVY